MARRLFAQLSGANIERIRLIEREHATELAGEISE
jgi:hypothetical protein